MQHSFKRDLIIRLSIALGVLFVLFLINIWLGSNLSNRANAIQLENGKAEFDRQAFQSLITLQEDSKKAKQYTTYLNTLLPDKDGLFAFRNRINAIGREEKMVLGFKFGSELPPSASLPPAVAFQLTASGPASGFDRLLNRLESSGYFVRLDSIEVTYGGTPSGETFNANFDGKVFYRRSQNEVINEENF